MVSSIVVLLVHFCSFFSFFFVETFFWFCCCYSILSTFRSFSSLASKTSTQLCFFFCVPTDGDVEILINRPVETAHRVCHSWEYFFSMVNLFGSFHFTPHRASTAAYKRNSLKLFELKLTRSLMHFTCTSCDPQNVSHSYLHACLVTSSASQGIDGKGKTVISYPPSQKTTFFSSVFVDIRSFRRRWWW